MYTNQGVVWSAGDGDFMVMSRSAEKKQPSMESALSSATGVSGGAAATIPGTFFKMKWGNQLGGSASNLERQADEGIGGTDCYAFASESKGRTRTLWIGKKDFLVHQVKTVISAEAEQAALDQAEKVTGVRPQVPAQELTLTETHEHITLNPKFVPADFAR